MANQTELNEMVKMQQAVSDMLVATKLAQTLYENLQAALLAGNEMASYIINPAIPNPLAEELKIILDKAQNFYNDLNENHNELLTWKP